MMTRCTKIWPVVLAALCLSASLAAEPLTVDSLIGLKQLGFSETEIRQQVTQSGTAGPFSEMQLEALKSAGFSAGLIDFLQHPQPAEQPAPQPPTPAPASPVGIGEERLPPRQPPPQPVAEPATPPAPPISPAPPAVSRQQVMEIQRCLNDLGYDAGSEDGIYGRRTSAAIRAFQQDQGLVVDGEASSQLLTQLRTALQGQGGMGRGGGGQQRLVGGWQALYQGGYGYATEMYLDLFADGSFTSSSSSAMGYAEVAGTYRVQGNSLILLNQYGQTESYPFRLQGQQLFVRMPNVGQEVIFTRYSSEIF